MNWLVRALRKLQRKRRERWITLGFCPLCYSSPPWPECPICQGVHSYGPALHSDLRRMWWVRWVRMHAERQASHFPGVREGIPQALMNAGRPR